MRQLTYFLILVFFAGCQTAPVRDLSCSSDAIRNPAALSCESIFTDTLRQERVDVSTSKAAAVPTPKAVDKAINELSRYGKAGERWTYIETVETQYRTEAGDPSVRLGQELLKRRQLGETTAIILTRLGYRDQYGYLLPPRNLALLYRRLYIMLFESAQAIGVDQRDVILPAFVFLNRENTKELMFVSPGIDPLPDLTKWQLPDYVRELNADQFVQMINSRKFILEPQMLSHDIGHLVDLIEQPSYHVTYRKYVEARNTFLNKKVDHPEIQKFGVFDKYTDQIINEWIYLPDTKNLPIISQIIPEFDVSKISSLESLKDKYRRLPTEQLKLLAQKFIKSRYQLFSAHGGGARDTSYDRFRRQINVHDAFFERIEGEPRDLRWVNDRPDLPPIHFEGRDSIDRFLKYQAPGLFERLGMTLEIDPQGTTRGALAEAASRMGKEGDLEAGRHEVLAIHLAEIESRLQAALHFRLNPEQMVRDMTNIYLRGGMQRYLKSPTYRYFLTYPVGSAPRFLFVDRFGSTNQGNQ